MSIERIIVIVTIVVVVFAAALFGVGVMLRQNTTAPAPTNTTQPNSSNNSTSVSTSQSTSNVVPQTLQTKEAVRAAFIKHQGAVKVGNIAIVGGWALLSWTDEPMGGEAVLKYDAGLAQWVVASFTGGAYSVAGLHELGIPQKTILALLNSLKAGQ